MRNPTLLHRPLRKRREQEKREITEEEICQYLKRKAFTMALNAANKLKATSVLLGYSNHSNPFHDPNLSEKFVWRKKIERDVSEGAPLDRFSVKAQKQRDRERMAEMEKVKKQRQGRALEKARREEQMAQLARERARAELGDQDKIEEEFFFQQSKLRSVIRMRQGRMKPIDFLFKYLNVSNNMVTDLKEPLSVFKGLTVKELKELRDDIKMHVKMDRLTQAHIEYWEALMVVRDWKLAEARNKDALHQARAQGEEPPAELLVEERRLHSSIEIDVRNLLEGKSSNELEVLQTQIESQMRSGAAKVVEYWEAVLNRLHLYKAKARLREIHANHLQLLQLQEHPSRLIEEDHDPEEEQEEGGSFSPQLLHGDDNEEAIDPEEDRVILQRQRAAVQEEHQRRIQEAMVSKLPLADEANFEKAMEEGDAVFGCGAEVNLSSQVYWWHDKYRPRKPKYMNRVHSGYEWNKYNRTHYDHDNPPPKAVQGYRFNIFYPDLIDRTKAPTYTIHKDGNSSETCIIRFHAGPPYEDIAFRIVNKDWEYSRKMGFKSTFERGILQLHFNFKRYHYRR